MSNPPSLFPASSPNILLVMCDQLRHDWLGYAGASQVRTPNIDALADQSLVFTQTVCNTPICAPSRIGLATGLRPHRLGGLDNHVYLPLSRPTFYQRLRNFGYQVGHCGKIDLAKPDRYNGRNGDRPLNYAFGFTHPHECEGKMHAGKFDEPQGPYGFYLQEKGLFDAFRKDYGERLGAPREVLRPSILEPEDFEDSYIGRKSCEMLRQMPSDFPWFFHVNFVGPHNPFDPPAAYYERYQDAPMPAAVPHTPEGKPSSYVKGKELPSTDEIQLARRLYSANVELIDDHVGMILQTLEDMGQRENTYILFAADHGEMLGDHGRWTKSVPYEASARVPLAICGPGINPGRTDAIVELNDLNPTICEIAGAGPIPDTDARSLAPSLLGQSGEHRDAAFYSHRGYHCIRTREWKLVENDNAPNELYDLVNDPAESRNLHAQEKERAHGLLMRLRELMLEGGCLR